MPPRASEDALLERLAKRPKTADATRTLVGLPLSTRQEIFQMQLDLLLGEARTKPKHGDLQRLAIEHGVGKGKRDVLIERLKAHNCSFACFIPQHLLPEKRRSTPMKLANVEYYADELTEARKAAITHFLMTRRVQEMESLQSLSTEHGCYDETLTEFSLLYPAMQAHVCDSQCLIRREDVEAFETALTSVPPETEEAKQPSAAIPKTDLNKAHRQRIQRQSKEEDEMNKRFWAENWPVVLEDSEIQKVRSLFGTGNQANYYKILQESAAQTTSEKLKECRCSFCGVSIPVCAAKRKEVSRVDISVLEDNRERLQEFFPTANIQVAKPQNGCYTSCDACWKCVRKDKSTGMSYFCKIPLLSWANGCWIGDRPTELEGLSFVEEMVIARARATRCWIKLRAIAGPGTSQRSASGNVCFHPQEISDLTSQLPQPISSLYEDIAVVFVTDGAPVTAADYAKTPLIARRSRILAALVWLKRHNPWYKDITIDMEVLKEYPEDGLVPYPTVQQVLNSTIRGEAATYTGWTQHDSHPNSEGEIPLYASGTCDVNRVEETLRISKLEAIEHVKKGGAMLKVSSGFSTISTYEQPQVYAYLWPTLFPYGCGFMDDPKRHREGFRPIKFHVHVRHLLKLADQRFQLHKSFEFVAHNLMLRRKSSYQAKLAVSRHWWGDAVRILNHVSTDALTRMRHVFLQRQAAKDYSPYEPANQEEEDILKLLSYVNTVSDHIPGSAGDVAAMREELRAIARAKGTPNLFFTLNPADAHNPLVAFYAGKDIDIDKVFPNVDSRYTTYDRAKILADNPVAGARFFHSVVKRFINIFLGLERPSRTGVFGRVQSYYGVVESQNRGSLHIHLLIWLEGAISPKHIASRCEAEPEFKNRLFSWLEAICKLTLPEGTTYNMPKRDFTEEERKASILTLPPLPYGESFAQIRAQFLREVLENSAQRHTHGDTCFKHMTRSSASMTAEERDFHCRFNLPAEVVTETSIDADGKIYLKRLDPFVVGYNPTISFAFGCNTDCKFIGSGHLGMAMSIYITNYTAKTTLDSATVMTAMTGVLLAEKEKETSSAPTPFERLMLKTLNQMVGRREMSAQQVASELLSFPNHYTNEHFNRVYWTSTLRWLSPSLYSLPKRPAGSTQGASDKDPTVRRAGQPDGGASERDPMPGEEDMVLLSAGMTEDDIPPVRSAAYDMLFRPLCLCDWSWWELLSHYEKVRLGKGQSTNVVEDVDEVPEDSEELRDDHEQEPGPDTTDSKRVTLQFEAGHPQKATHGLRLRLKAVIPVLVGAGIPRRDMSSEGEKYAMTMLALFKPWQTDIRDPLGRGPLTWMDAFAGWLPSAPLQAQQLMDHFEEQWECRNAADDFSRERRLKYGKQPSHFASEMAIVNNEVDDDDGKLEKHVAFSLSQMPPEDGDFTLLGGSEALFSQTMTRRAARGVEKILNLAKQARLYQLNESCTGEYAQTSVNAVADGDRSSADEASSKLADERARHNAVQKDVARQDPLSHLAAGRVHSARPIPNPVITTIHQERELIEKRLANRDAHSLSRWMLLHEWRQLAVAVCSHFTLNRQQKYAFVCVVDHRIRQSQGERGEPLRLIVGGPGGAGKSHIYAALKAWYTCVDLLHELAFVAPTGIAADNIDGATIHSFFGLQWSGSNFGTKQKEALYQRLQFVKLIIVDECYFVGCRQFGRMSRHINLSLNTPTGSFGDLDVVVSGDEFQLQGPNDRPLYSSTLVKAVSDTSVLQGLNDGVKDDMHGFVVFRQFKDCILLKDIVRQQNQRYVQFLGRLRRGNCTGHGPDNDVQFLAQFKLQTPLEDELKRWITNPDGAAPLVTYTNAVRDVHNWNMTRAFCNATGQAFDIYHSEDFLTGKGKTLLTGVNALQAWRTPIKGEANDLTGRLPLAIGMPVIVVHNMATELGICNGTRGILRKIKYFERGGKRFTVAVDVEIPRYKGQEDNKVVTIPAISQGMSYTLNDHTYHCRRTQVPIIGGFAFTIHNSQSQSLSAMIADLESSTSTAASYVLLSRIRCEEGKPIQLRIIGDVTAGNLTSHAAEQVRAEEVRLVRLQEETLRGSLSFLYIMVKRKSKESGQRTLDSFQFVARRRQSNSHRQKGGIDVEGNETKVQKECNLQSEGKGMREAGNVDWDNMEHDTLDQHEGNLKSEGKETREAMDVDGEVIQMLREFDLNPDYGPCKGASRLERWQRAEALGLQPPEIVREVVTALEEMGRTDLTRNVLDAAEGL